MNKKKLQEIDELIVWLEKEADNLERPKDTKNDVIVYSTPQNEPVLYSVIKHDKSKLSEDVQKRYKKYLSEPNTYVKNLEILAAGGALATAGVAKSMAMGTAGKLGVMALAGKGAAVSGLSFIGPIGWGILGGAIVTTVFVKKKFTGKDKEILEERTEKLEQLYKRFVEAQKERIKKAEENDVALKTFFKEYFPKAIEKFRNTSKKAVIIIDDIINLDQNRRIMEYQEIALKQYKSQVELGKILEKMSDAYNKIVDENNRLHKELNRLREMEIAACEGNNILK